MVLSLRPFIARRSFARSFLASANIFSSEEGSNGSISHESEQFNMPEINSQLKLLTKSGELKSARNLFDTLPQRDEVTWTIMISGYVNASNLSEALSLFSKMSAQPTIRVDPFALSLALKACGLNSDVNYGETLHAYSTKVGLITSVFVGSALLDMYMKNSRVFDGCRVFDEMPLKNEVSWTAIITGLVRTGLSSHGMSYFAQMWSDGVEYDAYTFAIALKACADLERLNHGRAIHARTMKKGVDTTSYVCNSLAAMYNKCGKLSYGMRLFNDMSAPDVVSWTSVITTFVQTGREEEAIDSFLKMRARHVAPNEYTYAAVISGVANMTRLDWGQQLHTVALRVGLAHSLSVANSLMTMYSKCGCSTFASIVFHEMSRRDVISWSTLIAGYSQGGCGEEAFELFSSMRREGPEPNEFTVSSVLSACGSMAILDQGRQLHAYALIVGLDRTAMTQSSLINLYSKCGSIVDAAKIFHTLEANDIVSWTAMINGYAEHGYSREAIDLFERIREVGLTPDSVTFIGVLSACSHVGLIDLGFRYFDSMSKEHRIDPSKEHYGCMIDLLCRGGRLREALRMTESMPFGKDDVVWSILLRASREHGDIECGRIAAEQVLKLDPDCAGTHITMANIYASKGKWKEAAEMRRMMKAKGVVKEPGWSWTKVKGCISAFVAGDKSHPKIDEIYALLELISCKEVTVQDLDSILNISEE
ncbi:putative pentatricopeptide repeat-containing protein At3g47840 [Andrographis paniculata]|uniref:putative pentatricopeptide repeat-containing protein At3g47840 n=1 Tax=Andrographis paniculata TaxID=175694 RepID=UPI0021E982E8|nr:putative pentatricopeptide repeat-containing protein At3g47840 [Andrographis paniculata]